MTNKTLENRAIENLDTITWADQKTKYTGRMSVQNVTYHFGYFEN